VTTSALTAQGKLSADPPTITELTPGASWRVSAQTVSWSGSLQSSNLGRVVYWWPFALPFSAWPRPILDPNVSSIAGGGGGNGYTEPPGVNVGATVAKGSPGATTFLSRDSPSSGLFPCLVRLEVPNTNDGPNRYTWFHLSPFTERPLLLDDATVDVDSQFRVVVRTGVRTGIDGGGP